MDYPTGIYYPSLFKNREIPAEGTSFKVELKHILLPLSCSMCWSLRDMIKCIMPPQSVAFMEIILAVSPAHEVSWKPMTVL